MLTVGTFVRWRSRSAAPRAAPSGSNCPSPLWAAPASLRKVAGFQAVKHQRFVGAGYFDQIQMTVTGGEVSTSALKGSTEEEQFYAGEKKHEP